MTAAARSSLFYRSTPGGLPAIIDVARYPGGIFYVDSNSANAGDTTGHGSHPDSPFATINYAATQCTASKGDVIIAMPGHVETVTAAAGLAFAVAGVKVICQGEGSSKATINFTTATSADMDIDAAGITLENPRFTAGIDGLLGPIDVNAADFKIIGGEWYDGTTIQTVDCVIADANADRMVIDGWTFHEGTAGTQKQSHIQVAAATNVVLKDIHATGDFATGIIENGTAWINATIIDPRLENTNATPKPGIALAATGTGNVYGAKITIASGVVPVTADNDMQWYDSAYSTADGSSWGTIGSIPAASLEGKVDLVLADTTVIKAAENKIDGAAMSATPTAGSVATFIASGSGALGTPLAASKSLVDALGTNGTALVDSATSIVGILGVNDADNVFTSNLVVPNADGSVLERQEYAQVAVDAVKAVTDVAIAALGTNGTAVSDSAVSVLGAIGANNADNAFASNLVVANADGSVLERQQYVQAAVDAVKAVTDVLPNAGALTTIDSNIDAVKAVTDILVAALGTSGTVITDDADSVLGAIGANNANNAFVSDAVLAGADGSVLERQQYTQEQVALVKASTDKVDGAALSATPTASSLTTYIAGTGTLGTALAAGKSLVDALGTNGTTLVDSATSIVGILGVNDADNAFASDAVVANEDGSVLERQQYAQAQIALVKVSTDKVDAAALSATPTAGSIATFVASGSGALGTPLAASKSLVDALGTNGLAVTDSAVSVLGAIGANNADNAFASDAVVANEDGSVLERQQYAQAQIALVKAETDKVDSASLAVDPTAGSIATFVASGGTALGTPLPDSKSLYDMVRQYGDGYLATKELTYDGNASYNIFTVTGAVAVKVIGYITTVLTNHGDSTSVGTATSAAGLIAATPGSSAQTANAWWVDNAPSKFEAFPAAWSLIGNGEEIAVVGTANIVGGVVTFLCYWKPMTTGSTVVAA